MKDIKYTLFVFVHGLDYPIEVEITVYSYGLARWDILDGTESGMCEDTEHEAIREAYEYIDEVHGEIAQVIKEGKNVYV